ncbi:hypothetical protein MLD38_028243 [Melastoma candidum]|uniref:Uncharacterized protein n=1 Tax=Melastoma candidum TaxID=119954 RepID=A0ACB9N4R1_9MYRT|nr:hypothetical protein MLD38_028243 [Melastoma candidum]
MKGSFTGCKPLPVRPGMFLKTVTKVLPTYSCFRWYIIWECSWHHCAAFGMGMTSLDVTHSLWACTDVRILDHLPWSLFTTLSSRHSSYYGHRPFVPPVQISSQHVSMPCILLVDGGRSYSCARNVKEVVEGGEN